MLKSKLLCEALLLAALAIAIGTATIGEAGGRVEWNSSIAIVGLAGVIWSAARAGASSPLERLAILAAIAFPAYAALQLIPVPLFLLRILDPTRAAVAEALGLVMPSVSSAPLSIAPLTTSIFLSGVASCVLIFFLIRQLAHRSRTLTWLVAPLLVIGGVETAIALAQHSNGSQVVTGTYYSKDHFAGLLEMVLPFSVMYGIESLRGGKPFGRFTTVSVMKASGFLALAALMFAGIIFSLSKMAFLSMLGSLFMMGGLGFAATLKGRNRWIAAGALAALSLLVLVFLPPDELVRQLGAVASDQTGEGRLPIAKDTLHMIAAYPAFGVGLGAYYPGLLRYQTYGLDLAWLYAHNDYLQLLSELGVIGFLIPATLICAVFFLALKAVFSSWSSNTRTLGLACAGAMAAILIHSLADFNLYVLPNAMVLAWVSGIAVSLRGQVQSPEQPPGVRDRGLRAFVLALGCLTSLYAGGWLVFVHSFQDDLRAERLFRRFGIFDSYKTLMAVQRKYGGEFESIPPVELADFLRSDPAATYRWADLGASLQLAGRTTEARICFNRALALGPRIPGTLFEASQFHFGLKENTVALDLMTRALEASPSRDERSFVEYDQRHIRVEDILRAGLPSDSGLWRSFLRWQMQHDRTTAALTVWSALMPHGYADDQITREFTDFLISKNQPEAAQEAWALYAAARSPGYPDSDRVFNGDFESQPSGVAFDWRIEQHAGALIDFDKKEPHSGVRSLRVQFDGSQNLDAAGLSQIVWLKPGSYRLQAYVRAEDLSTDEGIAFRVRDPSGRFSFVTESVLGSTDWRLIRHDFQVPASEMASITLMRKPSQRFDSLIHGTLWIDQVSIRPEPRK